MNERLEDFLEWLMVAICIVPGVLLTNIFKLSIPTTEEIYAYRSKIFWLVSVVGINLLSLAAAVIVTVLVIATYFKYEGN